MGTGYTRQSAAQIVTGETVEAAPINAEFNVLQSAFNGVAGHSHDGSTGEGPLINLANSVTGVLPVANGGVNGINNVSATTAPTVNDDSDDGYAVGSIWVNVTTDLLYVCLDNTATAAVWRSFQPVDAGLTSISGLTTAADRMIYTTANDVYAVTPLTAFGRSLVDDATASDAQTTLGVSTYVKTLLDDTDAATARATLGLGTVATQAASSVAFTGGTISGTSISGSTITGGSITGMTDIAIADGGTGASTAANARTNLGLGNVDNTSDANKPVSIATQAALDDLEDTVNGLVLVPPGAVMQFAMDTAPTGWLKANGSAISRTTYSGLFSAIGTTYGSGDGSTTFNVPDLRAEFVRGWDDSRGVDSGRVFGSTQSANIEEHLHTVNPPSTTTSDYSHDHTVSVSGTAASSGSHAHGTNITSDNIPDNVTGINTAEIVSGSGAGTISTSTAGAHTHSVTASGTTASDLHDHTVDIAEFNSGSTGTGTDTRPRNIALLYCIKT